MNRGYIYLILFALGACAATVMAPVTSVNRVAVQDRSTAARTDTAGHDAIHIVRTGDTLYAIAWKYSYDYRQVAAWNNIKPPYTIYPGQRISVRPSLNSTSIPKAKDRIREQPTAPHSAAVVPKPPTPQSGSQTSGSPAATTETRRNGIATGGAPDWRWPTSGKIINIDFPTMENGANISGMLGQPILAAADGEIVYSGSGLLGYGKLIIIKHNATYLSAYAHNRDILKSEGNQVRGGETIATMGTLADGLPVLHFEIRKNGKAVDPLGYLPKNNL